jgi:hypothetical protein
MNTYNYKRQNYQVDIDALELPVGAHLDVLAQPRYAKWDDLIPEVGLGDNQASRPAILKHGMDGFKLFIPGSSVAFDPDDFDIMQAISHSGLSKEASDDLLVATINLLAVKLGYGGTLYNSDEIATAAIAQAINERGAAISTSNDEGIHFLHIPVSAIEVNKPVMLSPVAYHKAKGA